MASPRAPVCFIAAAAWRSTALGPGRGGAAAASDASKERQSEDPGNHKSGLSMAMKFAHRRWRRVKAWTCFAVTRCAVGDIAQLALADDLGEGLVGEQDVVLEIQFEAAAVEIGRTDQADALVDDHGLGVEQAGAILVELDPGVDQVAEIAAAGRGDDPAVDPGRQDQHRPNPAQRG